MLRRSPFSRNSQKWINTGLKMENLSDPEFWLIPMESPSYFFLPLHRGLELFHGDCVQYFAQNDLSDLHAFVCFSIKKVLARALRI